MRLRIAAALAAFLLALALPATASSKNHSGKSHPAARSVVVNKPADGVAEARLIEIYALIGKSQMREAFARSEALVRDLPNFQLAQLVYGDLLAAKTRPLRAMGDVTEPLSEVGSATLAELRDESVRRIQALRERPRSGTIPSQFLNVPARTRHAIAVDTSRSRLYLFENSATGLNLLADYYISIGKSGTLKTTEGDQRTPLGVYFISANLDRRTLKDFYGSGALPLNYPNVLDSKRGKTGGGIWLHGTPPEQFARAPQSSDGCVVLANPDLERIIQTVEIRSTPVVIASRLQWVSSQGARIESKPFEDVLAAWHKAKSAGDLQQVLSYYTPDFSGNGKPLEQWLPTLRSEIGAIRGRPIQLKDLSIIRWIDTADTMVVTFGEVADGARTGWNKRQYWIRQDNRWKIFFEGIIG